MSTPQARSLSQSPLRFGDPRPTSHVTSTFGLPSRHASINVPPSEGAVDLLRNVKEDDEIEAKGRKRSDAFRAFGRRSPSLQGASQMDDATTKHYVKMGILMSDDARVTQSLTTESGAKSAVHKTHTLPSSSPRTRPSLVTERREDELDERLPDGARPVSRPRTNSSGFEFVDIERTDDQRDAIPQPSPPISVKSESSNNTIELQSSSPDSGYGNTPEYVNAARSADSAVKGQEQSTKNETVTSGRERGDTSNSEVSIDSGGVSPGRERSVAKAPLKHTQSVPDNLAALNQQSLLDPVPERGVTLPFHMSLGPGRPVAHETETRSVTNFGDMERQLQQRAHHHVNPSQPTPQPKVKGEASGARWKLDVGRRKNRANSQSYSTVADDQSVRSAKASTLSTVASTKDYFQVTDELSKENSHFSLSEALLSVIEQYKANCLEQQQQDEGHTPPGTPPPHHTAPWRWSPGGLTPLGGGHYLDSPPDDSLSASGVYYQASPVDSISSPAVSAYGSEVDLTTSTQSLTPPTQSKPPTQLSLLELMQSPSWDNSAESTAQKLLRHMTGHMTKAGSGDMQVVVQVPTEFLTSLQKDEDLQRSVTTSSAHMRGNREWAPPRKQIIYSVKQPSRNLQKELAAQGFRCTGCGMKVDPTYIKYFRFCNYTGKYFCPNCHMNATSIVPAHILERWSFKKLAVSNFARDLLAEVHQKPVFTITSSNYSIYKRVPLMVQAKELRAQLISVKQYLSTCRKAHHLNLSFQGYAPWTVDLHTYSIEDFLEVKGGNKMKYLRAMLADGVDHIKSCPLCMGKGFVCELCDNDKDVIFPFEGGKVQVCKECQCCFHKTCYTPSTKCPRCHRMQQRLKQRTKQQTRDYSDRPS